MDFMLRPLTKEERLYLSPQPNDIASRTLFGGELEGKLDGTQLWTRFTPWYEKGSYPFYNEQLTGVINCFRFHAVNGLPLHDLDAMRSYMEKHPEFDSAEEQVYAFRVDAGPCAFLFHLIPQEPVPFDTGLKTNLKVMCYNAEWLDKHIEKAKTGIDIRGEGYKTLFHLPDNGKLKLSWPNGAEEIWFCRYIDPYHFTTTTGTVFHIDQFAELIMRQPGIVVTMKK